MTAKKSKTVDAPQVDVQHIEEALVEDNQSFAIQDTGSIQATIAVKPITVVIPYCASEAQGRELLFALRSWQKNFKESHNIVIIGDREEWFKDEELTFIEMSRVSDNPQINVMESLKAAIASDAVSDKFIWSNDDIYLVAPIGLEYISIPKMKGALSPDKFNDHYKENILRTIDFLRKAELPLYNYGTHTPVLYDKEMIVELLEQYPEIGVGDYLFSSIYFNKYVEVKPLFLDWKTDKFLLPVVSKSPDKETFFGLLNHKVFMNNAVSGYSAFFEEVLNTLFPGKSVYEK